MKKKNRRSFVLQMVLLIEPVGPSWSDAFEYPSAFAVLRFPGNLLRVGERGGEKCFFII